MTTFMSFDGPFTRGIKPKSYFEGAKELLKEKQLHAKAEIKAKYTKYNVENNEIVLDAYSTELFKMIPWMIAAISILINLAY